MIYFVQDISRAEDTLATLKAMQGQTPSSQLDLEIARTEKEIELYSQEKLCYEAQILRVCYSNPNPFFFLNTCTCKRKKKVFYLLACCTFDVGSYHVELGTIVEC